MKFIKINEDMYISATIIQGFVVNEVDGAYWVQAGVADPAPINLASFKTRKAAQKYLAELVAKLNGDD